MRYVVFVTAIDNKKVAIVGRADKMWLENKDGEYFTFKTKTEAEQFAYIQEA